MTVHAAIEPIALVPETAPFSAEQRAWLSGFLAALIEPDDPAATAPAPGATDAASALASNDDAPWHDPALALEERMTLAEGRSPAARLMAAMAQQDCGQCGYSCAAYANALFQKTEARLNLCAPGGKETARRLKALAEELGEAAGAPVRPATGKADTAAAAPGRDAPATARFLSRSRLNKSGSAKETYHILFDLAGSGLDYAPGDSFGIYPRNDPRLVDAIVALLGARPEADVGGKTLRDRLIEDCALGPAPDSLFQLISHVCGGERRRKARALASGEDPDGDLDRLDILGTLHKFSGVRVGAEAFVEALEPMQPRLYSISSSPRIDPSVLTLTVDAVRYRVGQRERLGVASTYLAERVAPGDTVRAFVQKAHAFALPADPATPIVMVGPGTGVAPFRAFLQERIATGAPGRNWLFFGHQHLARDFFYREELEGYRDAGKLHRLTLAWSRDGADKIYVQDRMREVGADLWQWLADGAHFYVCGDAKRMAKDVERALVDIAAKNGNMSTEAAIAWVAALKRSGRYQSDVY